MGMDITRLADKTGKLMSKPEVWKKLSKKVLTELYYEEPQLTLKEIAKISGCSVFIIRKAMDKYGLKRRSTSEAMKLVRSGSD